MTLKEFVNESFALPSLTDKESKVLMKKLKTLRLLDKNKYKETLERVNEVRRSEKLGPISDEDVKKAIKDPSGIIHRNREDLEKYKEEESTKNAKVGDVVLYHVYKDGECGYSKDDWMNHKDAVSKYGIVSSVDKNGIVRIEGSEKRLETYKVLDEEPAKTVKERLKKGK